MLNRLVDMMLAAGDEFGRECITYQCIRLVAATVGFDAAVYGATPLALRAVVSAARQNKGLLISGK